MHAPESFKQAFLKQMLLGFQPCSAAATAVSSSSMISLQERKNVIKLSADAAMAIARGSTGWTRGLIANLSKNGKQKQLLRGLLGSKEYHKLSKPCCSAKKMPRSKKIIRRCLRLCSRRNKAVGAERCAKSGILARALVKQRIQVLRKIVPGGESMDASSLLHETLDYAVSLKAQVDLMRRLLKASQASILPKCLHFLAMKVEGQGSLHCVQESTCSLYQEIKKFGEPSLPVSQQFE